MKDIFLWRQPRKLAAAIQFCQSRKLVLTAHFYADEAMLLSLPDLEAQRLEEVLAQIPEPAGRKNPSDGEILLADSQIVR